MENMALLIPYILMTINMATLVGILGYGAFCALSKVVPSREVSATS